MAEEYVIHDDEVGLMHIRPPTHFDIVAGLAERIIKIADDRARELDNLIDFILYPHTHEKITRYANDLRHRLEEK